MSLLITTPSIHLFLNVDNSWKLLYTIQKNVSLLDCSLILPVLWIWPICFNNTSNFVHLTVQSACCYVAWEFPVQKIAVLKIIFNYISSSFTESWDLRKHRRMFRLFIIHKRKRKDRVYGLSEYTTKSINLPSMSAGYPHPPIKKGAKIWTLCTSLIYYYTYFCTMQKET